MLYFPSELPPPFVGFCGCLAPQPLLTGSRSEELLLRCDIGFLSFLGFESLLFAGIKLFKGWVVLSLKANEVAEKVVPQRHFEPLVLTVETGGIHRVIMCFGVYGFHSRRLIGHDCSEPRLRLGNVALSRFGNSLKIGQILIVVVLKHLVRARPAAEIKGQLQRPDQSGKTAQVHCGDTCGFEHIGQCGGAKCHHEEIEPTRPVFKQLPLSGVVQRVSKRVKDEILGVVSQFQYPLMSSSSSFGGFGWLGPQPRFSPPSNECEFSIVLMKRSLLSCVRRKGCSGSRVLGAARNQTIRVAILLSTGGCPKPPQMSFHPAVFSYWGGMNTRGGVGPPPRIPRLLITGFLDSRSVASGGYSAKEHALGYFAAEHHGTAEHQNRAGIRTWRILKVHTRLRSTITGARAGARGGFSRHRQPFRRYAAHG